MEVGDVFKVDFTDVLSPGKEITIRAAVMLVGDPLDSIPEVIYLKTFDGHTSEAVPGDKLRMKRHVLGASVPARIQVYEVPEGDDVSNKDEEVSSDPTNAFNKGKNLHPDNSVQAAGSADAGPQAKTGDPHASANKLTGADDKDAQSGEAPNQENVRKSQEQDAGNEDQDPSKKEGEDSVARSGPDPKSALPTKAPQSAKDAEKLQDSKDKHPSNENVMAAPVQKSATTDSTKPVK